LYRIIANFICTVKRGRLTMAITTLQKTALAIIFVVILIIIILTIYTFFCWLADRRLKFVNRECADIIIVGGGTAACVLGRRLHEAHPHLHILMMERGADRHADPKVFNVAKALEVAYSPPYSEVLQTKSSHELREAQLTPTVSVATMLGGASSHNYSLVVVGSPEYYNRYWKQHLGLSYHDLSRSGGIFDRMRCQLEISDLPVEIHPLQMIGPAIKKAYHKYDAVEATRVLERTVNVGANSGPLRAPDNISDIILIAIKATRPSARIVDDYNCKVVACASKQPQLFVDGVLGIRGSADVTYLSQTYRLSQLDKLQLSQDIAVDKILMNGNRASGVQWRNSCGDVQTTKLNRGGRVILSAGAIYSSVLLQNSGIAECTGLGNKIGVGLINHYGCTLIFETKCNFNFSSGPVSFVPNDKHNGEDRRDWQMIVGGAALLNPALLTKVNRDPKCGNFTTMLNWLLHPRARGWVKANHDAPPTIDLNMYEDGSLDDEKSDIFSIVQGLRWMYQVVLEMRQSKLFDNCSGEADPKVVFPPDEVMVRYDLEELEQWAKIGLSQTDHYCATNALGRVVDPDDFKVYGTKNLHVVDASVFPMISDGNMQWPVMAMAEVASDRISKLI
jgi:choline dehydrogenase-like flavoprotein